MAVLTSDELEACCLQIARNRRHLPSLIKLARHSLSQGDLAGGLALLIEAAPLRDAPAALALEAGGLALQAGNPSLAASLRSIAAAKQATLEQLASLPRDDSAGFDRAGRSLRVLLVNNIFPPQELGGY